MQAPNLLGLDLRGNVLQKSDREGATRMRNTIRLICKHVSRINQLAVERDFYLSVALGCMRHFSPPGPEMLSMRTDPSAFISPVRQGHCPYSHRSGSAQLRRQEPHDRKLKSNHSASESLTASTRQESDEFRKTKVAARLPERRWYGPTRISLSNVP